MCCLRPEVNDYFAIEQRLGDRRKMISCTDLNVAYMVDCYGF